MKEHHISILNRYFGDLKLEKIHIGHLSDYQRARMENRSGTWKKNAGPSIINHELSVVHEVMKRAKLWAPIADAYNPLPKPALSKPKVLNDIEERHLFAVAASRPEWQVALLAAKLTRNSTASGCELRNLKFEDVILDEGNPRMIINESTAKNRFRARTIRLNLTAKATLEVCMERAKKCGSHLPEHYIFPKRIVRNLWDPYKPASSAWIRTPFEELRKAAGFPWLTPHCFRHMAITVMLEQGASPETVRHIAGHVSEQMMRHYSHNRLEAQKSVLEAMDSTPRPTRKRSAATRAQQREFLRKGRRRLRRGI
jgi:integrase